ncbi:hypothetical protein [Micromonospora sp. RL09-050-HVF-A]|uniref:hypothetical protein n=1 Tax=Micromonospora sp. RL09-050-HVF-A TaxID=1703433 RepID=UPI00210517F8|nr:hypothetical protein [Micromonospora sp. RL09-050-HVF-A]
MKIYADRFPVALRQFLTDLLVVVWVYAAIRFAMWLYDLVEKLAVPGRKLEGPAAASPTTWPRPAARWAGCRWSATS